MDKVFKSGPSKIFGRQSLKNLKGYGLLKKTIPLKIFKGCLETIFTWSILEYFVPHVDFFNRDGKNRHHENNFVWFSRDDSIIFSVGT